MDRGAEIVDVHACNHGGGTAVKSKRQCCRSRLTIGTRRTNLSASGLDRSPPQPLSSVSRRSALVLLISYASVTANLLHRSRSLPVVRAFVRIFQSVAECLEIVNFSFEGSVPPCTRYFLFPPRGDRIEEFDRSFVASNRDTDRLSYRSPTRDEKRRRCRSPCGIIANITRSSRAADIMKSKTSENFIASESNGVKREQQSKQKQLKSGKRLFSHRIKTATRDNHA